ncbi:MAG: M20/M25/M40 family metallo-hydrolase [Thermoleophilia bacterium]|nr:M20/M25/M40 family metallo-hydrolase [Thermoleophilia bacterium]
MSPGTAAPASSPVVGAGPGVAEICSTLIRFDTSNPGGVERAAAEYVAGFLADLGLEPVVLECEPGRSNVVVRLPGVDPTAPALLVHGHLDTVPAVADDWTHHPQSGEIAAGQVWGRGAVDMKHAVAMDLAAVAELVARGRRPRRDIVLAFVADEETGGQAGARFLVHEHPELFEGCRVAIGEVGGFSIPALDGTPTFAVSVADKGLRWYELRRRGVAGHGSMLAKDNPITGLAATLQEVAGAVDELIVLEPMRLLAEAVAGRAVEQPEEVRAILLAHTGAFAPLLAAALRNTVNVTRVGGGYKDNVIPSDAWARLDCRYLPGHEERLHRVLVEALPERASLELVRRSPATEPDHASPWFEHLAASLRAVSPAARVVPYVFSGGTDNKWFAELGLATFGFTPLSLPAGFDFPAMFHGVDERVPIESLEFGVRVLTELLAL